METKGRLVLSSAIVTILITVLAQSGVAQPRSEELFVVPWDQVRGEQGHPERPVPYGIQVDRQGHIYINTVAQSILEFDQQGALQREYVLSEYIGSSFSVGPGGTIVLTMLKRITGTVEYEGKMLVEARDMPDHIAFLDRERGTWQAVEVPRAWAATYPLRIGRRTLGSHWGEALLSVQALDVPERLDLTPAIPWDIKVFTTDVEQGEKRAIGPFLELSKVQEQAARQVDLATDEGFTATLTRQISRVGEVSYFQLKSYRDSELDAGDKDAVNDYYDVIAVHDDGSVTRQSAVRDVGYPSHAKQPIAITIEGDVIQMVPRENGIQIIKWRVSK